RKRDTLRRMAIRPSAGRWWPPPSRAHLGGRLVRQPIVALLLQRQRQFLPARLDDTTGGKNVHEVRDYVVQQTLIVRDDDERTLIRAQLVHAVSDGAQCVDVQPGVGL